MPVQVPQRIKPFIVARGLAQQLKGPIGQDLVDVHVGRGAGTALEGIDDHRAIQRAGHHLTAGGLNGLEGLVIPRVQFLVGTGGGQFDGTKGMDQSPVHGASRQWEVLHGARGMDTGQAVCRQLARAQEILFCTCCRHDHSNPFNVPEPVR